MIYKLRKPEITAFCKNCKEHRQHLSKYFIYNKKCGRVHLRKCLKCGHISGKQVTLWMNPKQKNNWDKLCKKESVEILKMGMVRFRSDPPLNLNF